MVKIKILKIEVRIIGDKIAKVVQKEGFDDSLTATLEVIGLLENIKAKEMERLRTFVREEL